MSVTRNLAVVACCLHLESQVLFWFRVFFLCCLGFFLFLGWVFFPLVGCFYCFMSEFVYRDECAGKTKQKPGLETKLPPSRSFLIQKLTRCVH